MAEKTNTRKANLSSTEKAILTLAVAVDKAANKIDASAYDAIVKITKAADVASDKLTNDAMRATDVVANNAAIALKVSNATPNLDHDLLTKVDLGLTALVLALTEVKKELKEDIKEIKDGTSSKIEDNRRNTEAISLQMPTLLSDVKGLKDKKQSISDALETLGKIASNNHLLIRIGGAWLLIMSSIILFHVFGIKI